MGDIVVAERNARLEIEWANEVHSLYPDARGFFSYYTGQFGPTTWNSIAGVYGRYVLTLEVPVTLDKRRHHVAGTGEPRWQLNEVVTVDTSEGRVRIRYGEQHVLSREEWKKLYGAKGDWAALGIVLKKDAPVPDFIKAIGK